MRDALCLYDSTCRVLQTQSFIRWRYVSLERPGGRPPGQRRWAGQRMQRGRVARVNTQCKWQAVGREAMSFGAAMSWQFAWEKMAQSLAMTLSAFFTIQYNARASWALLWRGEGGLLSDM